MQQKLNSFLINSASFLAFSLTLKIVRYTKKDVKNALGDIKSSISVRHAARCYRVLRGILYN